MDTRKIKIKINSVKAVKDFVNVTKTLKPDVTIRSGSADVDGKSIMGLFTANLSEPIDCILTVNDLDHEKNTRELDQAAKRLEMFSV